MSFRIPLLCAAAALAMMACGSGASTSCGAGTVAKDGVCVPDPDVTACGPGTTLDDGVCYGDTTATPDDDAVTTTDTENDAEPDADTDTAADVACTPYCVGRNCGDDRCGGSCGSCTTPGLPICNTAQGVCVATCVPQCTGKNCGDNGCGGLCGTCDDGLTCLTQGVCVPPAWTCNPAFYAASDACDCNCGARDPDCDDTTSIVAGCASLEVCDGSGKCVSGVPAGWSCLASQYAALDACDCGCGAYDPDCAYGSLPVAGCTTGESCSKTGSCEVCQPECTDKKCGDDGCGGTCGGCDGDSVCSQGACVDPCSPEPIACQNNTCGDNGCGGSCGSCAKGSECVEGSCKAVVTPPKPDSCQGSCGSLAPSGCSCALGCQKSDTCCSDYAEFCACKPDCNGKQCGDDGCGGTCGTCKGDKPWCDDKQLCSATCVKACDGKSCGDDGCGGQCGKCEAGSSCASTSQCVADEWQCPLYYYADGQACDCGCGAPDPDCKDAKLLVFGCPTTATACDAAGLCKVTFCSKNADCAANQWCLGTYAAGGGAFKGVCGVPEGNAKAPGVFCAAGSECASGVCLQGLCRSHCTADTDCPGSERCIGLPVSLPTSTKTAGYTSVCASLTGSGKSCQAQATCEAGVEVCTAFVDPVSFGPKFLCDVGSSGGGKSCADAKCPTGQLCTVAVSTPVCGLACPGGAKDCPSGSTCGSTVFNDHGTANPADDPKVAACVPN
ncbi:MAG: hypothetical protein ACOYOB_16085 [Myxococcota bacterium]